MNRLVRVALPILALMVMVPAIHAQQGTPTPQQVPACVAEELPPGTPVSMVDILAGGTEAPEAQANAPRIPRIGIDVPPPSPPFAAEVIDGQPADEPTTRLVHDTVENLFSCLRVNHSLGFATLVTPEYRLAAFGTPNPYNAVMPLEGYPEVVLRSVGHVLVHGDGRLSADVVVVYRDTQVYRFRAVFIANSDRLLLDEEIPLPFDNADVMVDVLVDGAGLSVEPSLARGSSLIAFDVRNDLDSPATVSLIRIPASLAEIDPQADPGIVDRSAYMNSVLVSPDGRASFAVADLEPGIYTVIAVTENADGEPAVPPGAVASFTIH